MYRNTNISVRDLTPNTYIWPSSGVTENAQEIFCKQSGTITIFPFIGDMFTMNENDTFEIRVSNLGANNAVTLRTLMFSIITV